jgi:hypothetical protein
VLKQSQLEPSRWPEVVIAAASAREPFEDVVIVTARSQFIDLAFQAAADIVHTEGHALTQDKVHKVACTLIAAQKIVVQEHVRINSEGITVCLNVDDVNGEDIPWQALDYVARALDSLNGMHGVVLFSTDIQFTIADLMPTIAAYRPIK